MNDKKKLEFDLVFETFPVSLRGKDGKVTEYEICEQDGNAADMYLEELFRRSEVVDGKRVVTSTLGMEAFLLSLTMRNKETGEYVSSEEVQTWPKRVREALFAKAKEMNNVDAAAEERAKNDSAEETSSSGTN